MFGMASTQTFVIYDRHTHGRVVISNNGMISLGALAAPPFARRLQTTDQLRPSRTFLRQEAARYSIAFRHRLVDCSAFVGTRFHPILLYGFMDHFACDSSEARARLPGWCEDCDRFLSINTTSYVRDAEAVYARRMRLRALADPAWRPETAGALGSASTRPPPPPPPPPPPTRECHVCYDSFLVQNLVACGTCTCECCQTCVREMMGVVSQNPEALMTCPVCRTGMSAAACIRRFKPTAIVDVDCSDMMPRLLQACHDHSVFARNMGECGMQDIAFVWDGMRILVEPSGEPVEHDGLTEGQRTDKACTDRFEGIDIVPWSAVARATREDYLQMWNFVRANMKDGAIITTDPVYAGEIDKPSAFIVRDEKVCPLTPNTLDGVVLAVRAMRDKIPEHRSKHRVATFGLVCEIRAKHIKIAELERQLAEGANSLRGRPFA